MSVDNLANFPDLQRARERYVDLFQDSRPLVQLAYLPQQIRFTTPAIKLIEGDGEIVESESPEQASLRFGQWKEGLWSEIKRPPNTAGMLRAYKNYLVELQAAGAFDGMHEEEKTLFVTQRFINNPYMIWNHLQSASGLVVHLTLIDPNVVDINNLDIVAKTVLSSGSGVSTATPEKNSLKGQLGGWVGHADLYKAIWVDPDTKLEFAAHFQTRHHELGLNTYQVWRRLNPLTDEQGTLIPWGRKANDSQEVFEKAFEQQKSTVTQGALALQPTAG